MRRVNLSDNQRREAIKALEKRLGEQAKADVAWLMRQPQGRRFVYALIFDLCDLESGSLDGGIKDGVMCAMLMSRREGERDVGREILSLVQKHAPNQYLDMLSEETARRQVDALEREHIDHASTKDT